METRMIRIRQLQALNYVLSSRTMTAASELFGVTQPAMSRLIMQLEEEVGCQLLRRDRGRLRLTEEGQRFYEKAERVLSSMRELAGAAEGLRRDPKGEVRIISIYGFVNSLIPTAIAAFCAAYPKIRITIDVLNRARLEEVIHERQFDIALATLPVKSPPSLTIETLGALPAICVVPAKHALARKKVVKASDLVDIPFVSARRETLLRQRVDDVFDKLNIPRVAQFECHNTEVMCQLVGAGLGVSIVHPFVRSPADQSFVIRAFEPSIMMEYAMFQLPKGEITSATEIMAGYIRDATRYLGSSKKPTRKNKPSARLG
jgi:DNA-binding transcriptional LysR family regulator